MEVINRRVYLKQRPEGEPGAEHFGVEDVPINEVPPDHVLVKVDTLSMDAFIRTTLNASGFHTSTPQDRSDGHASAASAVGTQAFLR